MRRPHILLWWLAIAFVSLPASGQVHVQPTSLSFGGQLIGTESPSNRVSLFNDGASAITVSTSISGDFQITNNLCINGVQPGTHCDVYAAYTPTPAGSSSGTITFTVPEPNVTIQVPLAGIPSAISVTPASLNFQNVVVGKTGGPVTVTITNLSLHNVTIDGIAVNNSFGETNNCGTVLLAQGSCSVQVTFSPTEGAQQSGSLGIFDVDPLSPQSVSLTGYGVANPTPSIFDPLKPSTATAGSGGLTVLVHGTGFTPSSVLYWNGSPRVTTVLSASQLQARVLRSDLAVPTTAYVSVFGGPPEGGMSNSLPFQIISGAPGFSGFLPRVDYPVGLGPQALVAGDLKLDGFLDLVVGNSVGGSVSVLQANGDGTFQPHVDYTVAVSQIALGDFNEDGYLDVALAGGLYERPAILLGNGDGTLGQPSYFSSKSVTAIAVGDFNDDGELDLALLPIKLRGGLGLLDLGNGDGGFIENTFLGALKSEAAVPGDFNGDGKLDLAFIEDHLQNYIEVELGDGNGGLSFPSYVPSGCVLPRGIAAADFNGDGNLDLAVINRKPGIVAILLGNGDGTFQSPVAYGTGGTYPSAIKVGDLDGDGNPDLVITNEGNSFTVIFGKGDGSFPVAQTFRTAKHPRAVVIGDFNRDGRQDIAVANWKSNSVSVFLQRPQPRNADRGFGVVERRVW